MTDKQTLLALAERLTAEQRAAIIEPEWHGSGTSQFALVEGKLNLPARFAHMFTLRWDRLTDDALSIREELHARAEALS